MIGVAVAAVGIVGDQHIRLNLVNCGNQGLSLRLKGLRGQRGIARNGVSDGLAVRSPGHAGVAVEDRHALSGGRFLAEEEVMVHAQGLKGAVQLTHAILPQRLAVVGASGFANLQVLQLRRDNLAQLTAGRGDEVHLSALLRVVGHRCAG